MAAVAASSIPHGVRSPDHSHGCLVVSGTDHFSHGRRQVNQKHSQKKIVVWAVTVRKMLLEFPHEDAGLEALDLLGKSEQLKIGHMLFLNYSFKRSKD